MWPFSSPKTDILLSQALKHDEGLRLKPYKCTAGKLTIGYGRNLEANGISLEEAEEMLRNDVEHVIKQAASLVKKWEEIDPVRQAAIANMVYQLGAEGFRKFARTRKHIDARDWEMAALSASVSLWARQTPVRARRVIEQLRSGKVADEYKV